MSRLIDLTGKTFGRLTARESVKSPGAARWLCDCSCGSQKVVCSQNLRNGVSQSCGCLRRELAASARRTHGHSGHKDRLREYAAWGGMIDRCENPENGRFEDYGGRGIQVCAAWRHDFTAFLSDMGRRPSPLHSLDRIDVDGNYEPSNCRWATMAEQQNNKRNNLIVSFRGESLTLAQAWRAAASPVRHQVVRTRLLRGWDIERAMYEAPHPKAKTA